MLLRACRRRQPQQPIQLDAGPVARRQRRLRQPKGPHTLGAGAQQGGDLRPEPGEGTRRVDAVANLGELTMRARAELGHMQRQLTVAGASRREQCTHRRSAPRELRAALVVRMEGPAVEQ